MNQADEKKPPQGAASETERAGGDVGEGPWSDSAAGAARNLWRQLRDDLIPLLKLKFQCGYLGFQCCCLRLQAHYLRWRFHRKDLVIQRLLAAKGIHIDVPYTSDALSAALERARAGGHEGE